MASAATDDDKQAGCCKSKSSNNSCKDGSKCCSKRRPLVSKVLIGNVALDGFLALAWLLDMPAKLKLLPPTMTQGLSGIQTV